ncbi:hypothetical protein AA102526_2466 [Asaia lannensis NBRC 102526]|nr:hypothetical protein AA102526_2466 [Asaia lannensis NBRC 102526]
MRTAFQTDNVLPGFGKHRGGRFGMAWLAIVRSAGQSQFGIVQAHTLCCTRLDERKRQKRLDGRAWKDRPVYGAMRLHDVPSIVHDGNAAEMKGFDAPAARDFCKGDIVHGVILDERNRKG